MSKFCVRFATSMVSRSGNTCVRLRLASIVDRSSVTSIASRRAIFRALVSTTLVRVAMLTITTALALASADSGAANAPSQQSALVEAARNGDLKSVETLIASGIGVNLREHCNDTPLIAAARRGDPRIVAVLLKAGARVDFRGTCPMPQESVLCLATERGNLETVRLLMEAGAPPNGLDPLGRTPLMCASSAEHLEIMRFLLRKGADVNAVGSAPNIFPPPINTALIHAAMNGRLQAVELLLEQGARVNDRGRADFTALAYAAEGRGGSGSSDSQVEQSKFPDAVRDLGWRGCRGQASPERHFNSHPEGVF